jgi:hypothetical protein
MTNTSKLVVAGLPRTGKTSLIAAFWQYLESRESSGSLRLAKEPSDKKYLNHILGEWSQAIEITRTGTSASQAVALDLRSAKDQAILLQIPDFNGEAYRDLWEKGTWQPELLELAKEATGVLFCIHPQTLDMPVTVAQENKVLADAGLAPNAVEPSEIGAVTANEEPFNPAKSPTATKIVFLLQVLQEAAGRSLPIAVVVSAWDTMKAEAIPEEWLRETLPLVHQFLKANAATSPYAVFGISAMGGDVKVATVRTKLLARMDANSRIIVQEGAGRHNDVTRPITWLAGSGGMA